MVDFPSIRYKYSERLFCTKLKDNAGECTLLTKQNNILSLTQLYENVGLKKKTRVKLLVR